MIDCFVAELAVVRAEDRGAEDREAEDKEVDWGVDRAQNPALDRGATVFAQIVAKELPTRQDNGV
ncbi:MAG TPA: hypothetical protein VLM80_11160 [Anaerolineales bacterium]|nr:hypothetical protein [Anaerolineales bacterium]